MRTFTDEEVIRVMRATHDSEPVVLQFVRERCTPKDAHAFEECARTWPRITFMRVDVEDDRGKQSLIAKIVGGVPTQPCVIVAVKHGDAFQKVGETQFGTIVPRMLQNVFSGGGGGGSNDSDSSSSGSGSGDEEEEEEEEASDF